MTPMSAHRASLLAELAALHEAAIPAGLAKPGFYLSRKGRVLRIVTRSQVNRRWRSQRSDRSADVPYRSYADPTSKRAEDHVDVFGWLPADYPLIHTAPPRHVADQMEARATRFRQTLDGNTAPPTPLPRPSPAPGTARAAAFGRRDARLPPPGDVLERDYKGKRVRCVVGAADFEVGGRRYRTLSAAARSITGSEVNGFAFFGLNGGGR